MAIQDNDFIKLNITGKEKETGKIFSTTFKDVAEDNDILIKDKEYKPMILAVGSTQLVTKLHDRIKELDVGDKASVEVPVEEAFGKRDPKKIKLIPMKEFKKQNIKPFVGMPLTYDGEQGIVRTVSGGRVRVDFNHELAGKDIVYDIEIVDIIEDNVEKIKGLLDLYYGNPQLDLEKTKIEIEGDVAKITLDTLAGLEQRPMQQVSLSKFRVANETYTLIDEINKVQFIDEYEERKQEDEEESAEEPAVSEDASDVSDNIPEEQEEAPEVLKDDE